MTDGASARAWPTGGSTSAGCACTASKRAPARWWCCCTASPSSGTPGADPRPRRRRLPGGRARLPGYNTSDKPPRCATTRPRMLAQEVADLIVALGASSAAVAGHDWGGGLAWLLAMQHPERIQRLVVLNAPSGPLPQGPGQPPTAAPQLVHPRLPAPLAARAAHCGPGLAGAAPGPAASRPGRAPSPTRTSTATSPRPPSPVPWCRHRYPTPGRGRDLWPAAPLRRVDAPTLVIWGDQDRYLGRAGRAGPRWVPNVRVERIAEASHWCRPALAGQPAHGRLHRAHPRLRPVSRRRALRRGAALSEQNRLELRSAAALQVVSKVVRDVVGS